MEPTVAIIDITNDPNARSSIRAVTSARAPTPASTEQPTPRPTPQTSVSDNDLVGGIVTASMDPLMAGGRLGMIGGLIVGAAFVTLQRIRSRR